MLAKLFPKERDFFPVFDQLAGYLSQAISELLKALNSADKCKEAISAAREIEVEVDRLSRQSIEQLHETFITPFDRSHIFRLLNCLRESLSQVRLVIEKLEAYGVSEMPKESGEIVLQCAEACSLLSKMVKQLTKIKSPAETLNLCMNIYKISASTDTLAFQVSRNLYSNENDLKKFMKIREVNSDLANIMKKFEEISVLIEEIILEYA